MSSNANLAQRKSRRLPPGHRAVAATSIALPTRVSDFTNRKWPEGSWRWLVWDFIGAHKANVRKRSAKTIADNYFPALVRNFIPFVEERNIEPRNFDADDLEAYRSWIESGERGLSPRSQQTYLKPVRAFLRRLRKQGDLRFNPEMPDVQSGQRYKRKEEIVTLEPEQEQALLDGARERERDYLFINLLLQTGMRVTEALSVTGDSIREVMKKERQPDGTLAIFKQWEIKVTWQAAKGDRERMVPLPETGMKPSLAEQLRDFAVRLPKMTKGVVKGMNEPIFRSVDLRDPANPYPPLRRYGARDLVRLAAQEASKFTPMPRRLFPHILRHTFITNLFAGGATAEQISPMVGTSAGELQRTYGHVKAQDVRHVLNTVYRDFRG